MNLEERLKNLTTGKALIIGLVLAGLYYMLFFNNGKKIETGIHTTQQQIEKSQIELRQLQRSINEAKNYKKIIGQMGSQIDKAMKYLPEDFSVSDLMKILSTEAKASGASIIRIQDNAGAGEKKEFYEELKVGVELSGSYGQILLFLSYLTRVSRIITLESLRLQSQSVAQFDANAQTILKFSGTFIGYRYLPLKKKKVQ